MGDMSDFFSEMGNKQRDRRVRRFFIDTHGRRFFAWADKDNQRPIGEFVLADITGQFVTAPWYPAMSYISWSDPDMLDFAWDYAKLADELAGITAGYYDEAAKLARFIHVEIPQVGGAVAPEILSICGPPPLSPEIPLSCEAGEAWMLGRRGAPENKALSTILHQGRTVTSTLALDMIRERVRSMIEAQGPLGLVGTAEGSERVEPANYYEFMAAALKSGKTTPEAQREWKQIQAKQGAAA